MKKAVERHSSKLLAMMAAIGLLSGAYNIEQHSKLGAEIKFSNGVLETLNIYSGTCK